MRLRLLSVVSALVVAAGPAASGAWPRGPGETFIALQGWAEQGRDGPDLDGSIYVERGLTPRITLVGQFDSADDAWTPRRLGTGVSFALTSPEAVHHVALGFGVSTPPDPKGAFMAARGEVALSWGRGFETRRGPGWATATVRVIHGRDTKKPITDLYALVGLRPAEGRMAMLSAGRYDDDNGVTWKLTPALGFELRREVWLVPSVSREFSRDSATRLGLALWISF